MAFEAVVVMGRVYEEWLSFRYGVVLFLLVYMCLGACEAFMGWMFGLVMKPFPCYLVLICEIPYIVL